MMRNIPTICTHVYEFSNGKPYFLLSNSAEGKEMSDFKLV